MASIPVILFNREAPLRGTASKQAPSKSIEARRDQGQKQAPVSDLTPPISTGKDIKNSLQKKSGQ
jgi:hypothetical protein